MAINLSILFLSVMTCLVSFGRDKIPEAVSVEASVEQEQTAQQINPVQFSSEIVYPTKTVSPIDIVIQSILAQNEQSRITIDISKIDSLTEQDAIRFITAIVSAQSSTGTNISIRIVGVEKLEIESAVQLIIQSVRAMSQYENITISIPNVDKLDYAKMTQEQKTAIMVEISKTAKFKRLEWYEMENLTDAGTGIWALLKRVQRKVKNGENVDEEFKLFVQMIAETDTLNTYKEEE